jgi:hypothetical protein
METDGLSGEVHVAADESMRPKGVDPEGTTEQADGADLRTAADEDDRSRRMGLQVGPPGGCRAGAASIRAATRVVGARRVCDGDTHRAVNRRAELSGNSIRT